MRPRRHSLSSFTPPQRPHRIWLCESGIYHYETPSLRIEVHHHIDHPKELWFCSCGPLFDKRELRNRGLEDAKVEAIRMVGKELRGMLSELPSEGRTT